MTRTPPTNERGRPYERPVSARLRYRPGSPLFTPLKNGFGDVIIKISDESVRVTAVGPLGWLARLLGVNFTFDPRQLKMRLDQVVTIPHPISPPQYVILERPKGRRCLELAVRPIDGDLGSLRQALRRVGVQNAEEGGSSR